MNNSQLPVGMNDAIGLPPVPDVTATSEADPVAVVSTGDDPFDEILVEIPPAAAKPTVTKRRGRPRTRAVAEPIATTIEATATPSLKPSDHDVVDRALRNNGRARLHLEIDYWCTQERMELHRSIELNVQDSAKIGKVVTQMLTCWAENWAAQLPKQFDSGESKPPTGGDDTTNDR